MTKYTDKKRLCCILNRACYTSRHLKPFIKRHPMLMAKILGNADTGISYDVWLITNKNSPGFTAGWLYGMLRARPTTSENYEDGF